MRKHFIILLFVGKHPTNWLQVSVFEQLQGNLHCGPYQSAGQGYSQLIQTNPTHSMWTRSSKPSIKSQPLKTTFKINVLYIRNTYLYIPHQFFKLWTAFIGRSVNKYISLPIILFVKTLKAKSLSIMKNKYMTDSN